MNPQRAGQLVAKFLRLPMTSAPNVLVKNKSETGSWSSRVTLVVKLLHFLYIYISEPFVAGSHEHPPKMFPYKILN